MPTYESLKAAALSDGGLHRTEMWTLKEARGAGRLGVHVRDNISRDLESHGLGHLPAELPPNQEDEVRLYVLGTPIANMIRAVSEPSEAGDQVLRQVAESDANRILDQIRELVCE